MKKRTIYLVYKANGFGRGSMSATRVAYVDRDKAAKKADSLGENCEGDPQGAAIAVTLYGDFPEEVENAQN